MEVSKATQDFIENNIDLIEKDTKTSWEEVYKYVPKEYIGEFTQLMLDIGNDPAEVLGYVPVEYLKFSTIKDYRIPSNVTSIDVYAFYHCYSLKSIDIPDSVTSIDGSAFYACKSLISIEIPNSVKSIGRNAFFGCTSLTSIKYLGTKEEAMQSGIGNKARKNWIHGSNIQKIICTDGVINL